jgi:hypothetical protein
MGSLCTCSTAAATSTAGEQWDPAHELPPCALRNPDPEQHREQTPAAAGSFSSESSSFAKHLTVPASSSQCSTRPPAPQAPSECHEALRHQSQCRQPTIWPSTSVTLHSSPTTVDSCSGELIDSLPPQNRFTPLSSCPIHHHWAASPPALRDSASHCRPDAKGEGSPIFRLWA